MKRWDKDENGLLSREELPARYRGAWKTTDTDGDDKVTLDELIVVLEKLRRE